MGTGKQMMKSLKAGNKNHRRLAPKSGQMSASQRDAWDVAKGTDRRNRHRRRSRTPGESLTITALPGKQNKRIKELERKTVSLKSLMNFWRNICFFAANRRKSGKKNG